MKEIGNGLLRSDILFSGRGFENWMSSDTDGWVGQKKRGGGIRYPLWMIG